MSGRFYDKSEHAICKKCGSEMILSKHRNFWGPVCKNEDCDGGPANVEYILDETIHEDHKWIDNEDMLSDIIKQGHFKKE